LKIKKKSAMVVSFALGSILFASTAFAEVNSKSGYAQLKDALKYTAENCSSKLLSYTVDLSVVIKDNGNVVSSDNEVIKYDVPKSAMENKSTRINEGKTTENYIYSDKDGSTTFNSEQNMYYVNKLGKPNLGVNYKNPFKEKRVTDIEKIADAVVGNLKDSVVVTQSTDGTKQMSGTVSEAQIPSVANALVSYIFKTSFGNYNNNNGNPQTASTMSKIQDDIYVKEIKGNMSLNKDGLIEKAMGTGLLYGKDKDGKEHKLTFELLVKIGNVNKTVFSKPDLTGKKAQTYEQKDYNKIAKPEMYLGTYRNDIVIEKDSKFQKIGERIVEITSLDNKKVAGRYHEEYLKGNEAYSSKAKDFKFDTKFENQFNANIITDTKGNKVNGNMSIDQFSATISFNVNEGRNQSELYNYMYSRVFK